MKFWCSISILLLSSFLATDVFADAVRENVPTAAIAVRQPDDYEKIIAGLLPKAEAGDARAQFWVGYLQVGWIIGENAKEPAKCTMHEALGWIRAAARNNFGQAIHYLRVSYEQGLHTLPKNPDIALCLQRAANGEEVVDTCLLMDKR